jgi:hypothetical protein
MRKREDFRVAFSRRGLLETPSRAALRSLGARNSGSSALRTIALFVASLALVMVMFGAPVASSGAIAISVSFGPPALPIYSQPLCPAPGYMWTPGYWAWDPAYGYYWVPGTWVMAPFPGALWTPGYWGWNNGAYMWNAGYWGPVVGFYGGINYGFGYTGVGYEGGYWRGGAFYYNRAVNHINITNVRNVYNRTVINRVSYVSYNGGPGGVAVRPSAAQLAAARQRRMALTSGQRQQEAAARSNPRLRASINHGRPGIAATARPGVFSGRGMVQARGAGGPYHAPRQGAARGRAAARNANPGGTGRRPLITAPGHGNASRAARSAPSRGQPARRASSAREPRVSRATPSRRQPAGSGYNRGASRAARPGRNAASSQRSRRSAPPTRGTERRAAPQRQGRLTQRQKVVAATNTNHTDLTNGRRASRDDSALLTENPSLKRGIFERVRVIGSSPSLPFRPFSFGTASRQPRRHP